MSLFSGYLPEFPSPKNSGLIVQDVSLDQIGRIKYQASFWRAELYQPSSDVVLRRGQTVTVMGRVGLTLLVAQCPIKDLSNP